jgi:hypothetical protein
MHMLPLLLDNSELLLPPKPVVSFCSASPCILKQRVNPHDLCVLQSCVLLRLLALLLACGRPKYGLQLLHLVLQLLPWCAARGQAHHLKLVELNVPAEPLPQELRLTLGLQQQQQQTVQFTCRHQCCADNSQQADISTA